MERMRMRGLARASRVRRKALAGMVGAAIAATAVLVAAAPAMAGLRNDLKEFSNCPYNTIGVSKCVYSVTSSGEFVLGKAKVPITVPVIIQGGLNGEGEVIPPTSGEEMSRSAEQVPGGLLGLEIFGNLTEVFAVAELAGPAKISSAVFLPLQTKLENPVLGGNCRVGSTSEPISLELFYGPDFKVTFKDHQIDQLHGTLEDHSFSAPGANGCTFLPPLGDFLVDAKEGLPSPSGNAALLDGVTEEVSRRLVKEVLPLPAFGRCEKLPGEAEGKKLVFRGMYTNSGCTLNSVVNEGHYEWVEGPGANKRFTSASGPVTLATVGGKTEVKCSASSGAGEYTGAKTVSETITLTGCQTGPKGKVVSCQSAGAASGEVRSAALSGGLDFIKENEEGEKPEVGLDLEASSSGNLASFECGGSATSVSGSVIAPITTIDKMSSSFKVTAKQSGGKQAVEAFEESPTDTLSFLPGAEAGGLGATLTNSNEEPLEVKAEA